MTALTHVPVAPVSPQRLQPVVGERWVEVEEAIVRARRIFEGRVIWHVNSTPRGGGVAEMLQSLLAYARGSGVDVRWMAISGNPEFFNVTKRIHNNLHGSAGDGGELGAIEREIYDRTLAGAAKDLQNLVRPGDIVYLHDPQTAGMIEAMRAAGTRVVWRCHVGLDIPNELSRRAWDFLRPHVAGADAYVFSRKAFVWEGLDEGRLWVVPPSIDTLSPKNQKLDPGAVAAILDVAGLQADGGMAPVFRRNDGSPQRVERRAEFDQDELLPADAPLIAQVSRWDRLKDPVGVLRAFELMRSEHSHLLLAGPSVAGVADDPEGAEVLAEVRAARAGLPDGVRRRVHLACLPMNDVEENAAIVNAIQRRADIVVQKSIAEGFGLTVAEAMWKARPVVASRIGGIQDQIVDGESGVLIADPTDLASVAGELDRLLDDPARARAIGSAAFERVRDQFVSPWHLLQYVRLLAGLLEPASASR